MRQWIPEFTWGVVEDLGTELNHRICGLSSFRKITYIFEDAGEPL